jgi:hypothetical protein
MGQEFLAFKFINPIFSQLLMEKISFVFVLNYSPGTVVRYKKSDLRIPVIPNPLRTKELRSYSYMGKVCHQDYRNC